MITGSLSFVRDKNHNYNTDFTLYPKSQKQPVFADTPVNLFQQFTWLSQGSSPTDYRFKKIIPSTNVVGMLEGTAFEISVPTYDPSNLLDPNNDSNIVYIWKKDGSTLFEFSSKNNLKGTNTILITSESCTRDVSGVYELEATNQYGTTISEPITIDVINEEYSSVMYKNLVINGGGEQGLNGWTTDNGITTKQFSDDNRNQWSIPTEAYLKNYFSPYTEEFNFSSYGNETSLAKWFKQAKDSQSFVVTEANPLGEYNKWIISSFIPNLVPTDGGLRGFQDSFFPSWNYIDSYNKNNYLYKLSNIIENNKTYITRDKLKFTINGGKVVEVAYQDIDLTDASGLIDGETYGINQMVAHFFAYVGIGITNYTFKYVSEQSGKTEEDNAIPVTMFNYKVSALKGRPGLLPIYNERSYSGSVTTYNATKRDKYAVKIKSNTTIEITPVTHDKTDIRLDFLNENGEIIGAETIPGPTEKDIWAVKEKFFIPYHFGNLYGWYTNATNQMISIYSQSYTNIDAVLGVTDTSKSTKDINAAWVKKYHYPLFNKWEVERSQTGTGTDFEVTAKGDGDNETRKQDLIKRYGFNKSFIEQHGSQTLPMYYVEGAANRHYDRGAAAFFGIQKDVVVPKGTRTIRVNIIFNHTSDTIFDTNPKLKNWNAPEIYFNYFTKGDVDNQLVEYGNPRCGVTATHLSLHPNSVKISEKYSTYKIASIRGTPSVWQQQLTKLRNPQEYNSIKPSTADVIQLEYKYATSTIPDIVPEQDINTIPDIPRLRTIPGIIIPTGSID